MRYLYLFFLLACRDITAPPEIVGVYRSTSPAGALRMDADSTFVLYVAGDTPWNGVQGGRWQANGTLIEFKPITPQSNPANPFFKPDRIIGEFQHGQITVSAPNYPTLRFTKA